MNKPTKSEIRDCNFLKSRMVALREANGKSQAEMARMIGYDKSTLSRAEKIDGELSFKTVREIAEKYCDVLRLTPEQKEVFFRGERVVVVDTSAILKNEQLIDELAEEYCHIIVPDIVINELNVRKDRYRNKSEGNQAWLVLKSIQNNLETKKIDTMEYKYTGGKTPEDNDCKIIEVAKQAAKKYNCMVELISDDVTYAARLNGHESVKSLWLRDYTATKQKLTDIDRLEKLSQYYADSYDNVERILGIKLPDAEEINAYLTNGYTLIISAVRNKKAPMKQRKEKIRWLMAHGADVDRRDSAKHYFPPLSHAIQNKDFEMFCFLLHDCKANPNVGSRNLNNAAKFMQKNEGNMPLMIAAWDNRLAYVKELVADERTSLNQQDANGFTALIKACYWGFTACRDVLLAAGADEKIVDRDGYTAAQRYQECLETGRYKDNSRNCSQKRNVRGTERRRRNYGR